CASKILATGSLLSCWESDETPMCPRGWRQLKGYCYGFFNLNVNWMRAELDCQSIRSNSHLASIVNEEETDLLSKYLYQTYTQRKAGKGPRIIFQQVFTRSSSTYDHN
uniref:C-type lectin domain-containing protein n=1 Tax=Naja naja TaxID=35670 RepID=A0A8C6YF55_NAJNA